MLKQERRKQGLSQRELSDNSSVNYRMIQHYEQEYKDINNANPKTLYKLAIALGVPAYKIVSDKDLIRLMKQERKIR